MILSLPAAPSLLIKVVKAASFPALINAAPLLTVNFVTAPVATVFAFDMAVFKSPTAIVASLKVTAARLTNEPAVNSLASGSPSLTAFVINVPTSAIAEEDIPVTCAAFTSAEVDAFIVFRSAALLVLSALLMTIVHAFVSLAPVPGSYNAVKAETLEAVSIDAVTVPVVSAAIALA